jgi:hypothetical protein
MTRTRTTTAEGTAIAEAETELLKKISMRGSVEIESRSHYLSVDVDWGVADGLKDGKIVSTVCDVISDVSVMSIEVGVPDTSEKEKVTKSEVNVNRDVVITPPVSVILSAKAAAGTTVGTAVGVLAGMAADMLVVIVVGMAVGMVLGMSAGMSDGMAAGMVVLAGLISPREVAVGVGVVKTSPSLGSVSDRAAVVSVVPVPLLRSPAAEELVTSAAGAIDVTSLLGTEESMGPSGDVVVGSSEFPPVVVTSSVGEPVWVVV